MTGLSDWRRSIFSLLLMLILFGCAAGEKNKNIPPNIFLKTVVPGYDFGIKKIDGISTESFFESMPASTYIAPGRHNFEWKASVPALTPPFGVTGFTVITRCMWLDVVEKESYIIESKVNNRRSLFRVRSESGAKVSWGDCELTER